ncbi:MAG: AAC(3) family N-acetyltransferase [Phycisphaerae bacterium]
MNETARRIADDLRRLGVAAGDCLLVHSSLRSLGHVDGGAATVIDALIDALGPSGTLLLPALSYATVNAQQTTFDVRGTPSCVGVIPEYFRVFRAAVRSVHPTHSVAGLGPRAAELLGENHLDRTPCGEHSPFRKLRDAGGKLLMLGCGLRPNTSMHGVEELVRPPYLLGDEIVYRIILADGRETSMRVIRHSFVGWAQRYDRIEPLLADGQLRRGSVLSAAAYLIDCRAMWQAGHEALKKDPLHFVEPLV